MATYVALLRGINLGGNKLIRMERLRESLAALGFRNPRTYIQSGNVVFQAPKSKPATVAARIERMIVAEYGFSAAVTVRTDEELARLIAANPFLGGRATDPARLHVMFLCEAPGEDALRELARLTRKPDRSRCCGMEIYFDLPHGVAQSSLRNNSLERRLLQRGTLRNWRTVNEIQRLCQECG